QLEATPLASLERELIGYELHENSAYPILFRILKVAYDLQVTQTDLQTLDEVDVTHKEFERNWSAGRIIVLPKSYQGYASERWALQIQSPHSTAYLDLLNANPWLMLLALIVYAQDAWAAEHGA